ncbi:glutamate--cysteine ligase [Roseiterribacter gracilis]|uniref:Glutamate--cysteine ligase n=1 Tax=Roseiterribacter gracilis TaxID=2812848 RepID=A0A8S8XGF2_9PROT|nr:glutamate--cysteine ligase [Rhodospirillales bacterium TMPK1]
MSGPADAGSAQINDRQELVSYLESGSKPRSAWRVGTEHEKFAFRWSDLAPLPYDGPDGIGALLEGLARFGWERVLEGGKLIALKHGMASVTLEPGGQVELSGEPLETIHETCSEVNEHLRQVKIVSDELGIGLIGLGFQPLVARSDVPWMPKGRYKIMRNYMPKVGSLGLDMMLRTCTVQANLDFENEADMVRKFRVSLALQPIATALFASSPFTEGKPNGFQSYRANIWTDTDKDRTGDLPFVFEDGFGFERYVDYALDVPMYFVYRDGIYHDVAGCSFRDYLDGKLKGFEGQKPTMTDWADHLTTMFPEVRLKKYLEMRGADGGPWDRLCALPAFWVGLLYDDQALEGAWQLVKGWTAEDRAALKRDVAKNGLRGSVAGKTVQNVASQVLALAQGGLQRRQRRNKNGIDESGFLEPLIEIAITGKTPSDTLLERYATRWDNRVEPVFAEMAY